MGEEVQNIKIKTLPSGKERIYFFLSFILAFFLWIYIIISAFNPNEKLTGDAIEQTIGYFLEGQTLLWLFAGGLLGHFLAIAQIRSNAVRVGPDQLPHIWEMANKISKRLGLKKQPDVFVITGHGLLNAFAAKLVFRKIIVLYSDLIEALEEGTDSSQLEAVLAHEFGHHALNHTSLKEWFLWPADIIPIFALPLSRAREYSADKVMQALIKDKEVSEKALVKLGVGSKLGKITNIEKYISQRKEESSIFSWLSENFSTHPDLPNRIKAIRQVG